MSIWNNNGIYSCPLFSPMYFMINWNMVDELFFGIEIYHYIICTTNSESKTFFSFHLMCITAFDSSKLAQFNILDFYLKSDWNVRYVVWEIVIGEMIIIWNSHGKKVLYTLLQSTNYFEIYPKITSFTLSSDVHFEKALLFKYTVIKYIFILRVSNSFLPDPKKKNFIEHHEENV